jgi:hypothetical protein
MDADEGWDASNSMNVSNCSEVSNRSRRDTNHSWYTSNDRDALIRREPVIAETPAKQGRQQQQERQ